MNNIDSKNYSYESILYIFTILIIISVIFNVPAKAFENEDISTISRDSTLNVYLDFSIGRRYDGGYESYIKTQVPCINYVRDRNQADLHIMLSSEQTGSGGREYTMTFIGRRDFEGMSDTLTYTSNVTESERALLDGIVRVFKMGLVRYISKTPLSNLVSISYLEGYEVGGGEPRKNRDKWNYWVFRISVDGDLDLEESEKDYRYDFDISASRVTEAWKIILSARISQNVEEFRDIEENDTTWYTSRRESESFNGTIVKSLGEHLSAGIYGNVASSTYGNIELSYGISPAIEYSIYPYSESTRRQFTFLYRIGTAQTFYQDTTIFGKTEEQLFRQSLSIGYDVKEQWGSAHFSLSAANYLHDLKKNHITFSGGISLNLFEGFSLQGNGSVSLIHDQLSILKRDLTPEEILTRQKGLSTNYDIRVGIGITYTFGSIYENIVNPRFYGRYY